MRSVMALIRRLSGRGTICAVSGIRVSRVYDHEHLPGRAFLVDRLWPRGVRKEDLALEAWLKDVAPSTALRQWYAAHRDEAEEFRHRYVEELDASPEAWEPLADAAREGDLVLLFSSRDREQNNAVVLRDYLLERTTRA